MWHSAAGLSPADDDAALCSVLLGVDIYSFEQKISHIARRINLPEPPELGPGYHTLRGSEKIPPMLVINVQLPTYAVRPLAT